MEEAASHQDLIQVTVDKVLVLGAVADKISAAQ
jgi:hypothetical protein